MTESKVRVLDGGLAHCPAPEYREIHSCWITDTRLMGVLVLCVRWKHVDPAGDDLFHYFYFDYEEYGLDRCEFYAEGNRNTLFELETDLIGGLGGRKVAIRGREAVFLIRYFVEYNRRRHIPLPEGFEACRFYLGMEGELMPEEEKALWRKSCTELKSENALANYFMMRVFGRDFQGAGLLAREGVETDLFPEFPPGTLYRNQVILAVERSGCQCRSLVEAGGTTFLVVTELDFAEGLIAGYRRKSLMALSAAEVYMNMNHGEFVTVFRFLEGAEKFGRHSLRSTRRAVINQEHGGATYMLYRKDNAHVEASTYLLRNDLEGTIHVSNGQLLVSAQTLRDIHRLEIELYTSGLTDRLVHQGSFEFVEPVLLRYLESGFDDFLLFLEAIKIE